MPFGFRSFGRRRTTGAGDSVSTSSRAEEKEPPLQSVRRENERLRRLLKEKDLQIRTLTEKIEQLGLEPVTPESVPASRSASFVVLKPTGQGSQISSCGNCERKNRMLKDKDETIATLLSNVLWRLVKSKSRGGGGDCSSQEEQKVSKTFQYGFSFTKTQDANMCGSVVDKVTGILQQERLLRLFDQVLPLIIRQLGLQPSGLIDWRELWPFVLSCRLVCKSWKRSVDTLLENDPSHLEICSNSRISSMTYAAKYTPCPATLQFDLDQSTANQIAMRFYSFTEYFKEQQSLDKGYNPIPSRHLKIDISLKYGTKSWTQFSSYVLYYLESFGTQVFYLTLQTCTTSSEEIKSLIYKSLKQWLRCVPNLKSLITNISYYICPDKMDILQRNFSVMQMKEMAYCLPRFKNLVTYQVEENCKLGYSILSKNRQRIQKLRMSCFTGDNLYMSKMLVMSFQNLTDLTIFIGSEERIQKLGVVDWKLRKLSLSLLNVKSCSVESVVTMFQNFRDTLEYLTLDMSYPGVHGRLGETPLNLPRLKYLRVQYTQEPGEIMWMNLLVGLTQLESLEIIMNQLREDGDVENRTFSVYEELMFWNYVGRVDKICWNSFPQLKSVRLIVEKKRAGNKRFQHISKRPGMSSVKFDVTFSENMNTQSMEMDNF